MAKKKVKSSSPPRPCPACSKRIHHLDGAIRAALWASARYGHGYRIYDCPAGNGLHLTKQKGPRCTCCYPPSKAPSSATPWPTSGHSPKTES